MLSQEAECKLKHRAQGGPHSLLLLLQEQSHTMKASVLPASLLTHFGECCHC